MTTTELGTNLALLAIRVWHVNHEQEAYQLVGLIKTPRQSTLQSRQTFSQIQCVITGDLASHRDQIVRLYAGRTRFIHFCTVLNRIVNRL